MRQIRVNLRRILLLSTSKCCFFVYVKMFVFYYFRHLLFLLNVVVCVCSHFSLLEVLVFSLFKSGPRGSEISTEFGVNMI